MRPGRIDGATHNFGAPKNWDPDRDGYCGVLPVRMESDGSNLWMVSSWEPTKEELQLLLAGGTVHLRLSAPAHPVVSLSVNPAASLHDGLADVMQAGAPKGE